jgi:archaellum component FlaC
MRMALVVLLLVLAGLAAGCGDSDDETSPTTDWANDFCSAVTTWTSSITTAGEELQESGLTEESLDQAVDDVRSATETLSDDLGDLGEPETEAGDEAAESVEELSTALEEDVDEIETALEDVSGLGDLPEAVPAVRTALESMGTQVRSTVQELQGLDVTGELRSAFEEASACDNLTS